MVLLATPVVAAPPEAAPGEVASALVRTTFVVSDLARSKRFYQEAFGYRTRFEGDITTPATRTLLGLKPGQSARFVVLDGAISFSGKRHEAGGIGLVWIGGGPRLGTMRHPRGNVLAVGQPMFAIETSDAAAVLARLRRLGAPILAGPLVGHEGHETEIVTRDPDGLRIHIVEQRP